MQSCFVFILSLASMITVHLREGERETSSVSAFFNFSFLLGEAVFSFGYKHFTDMFQMDGVI